MTSSLSKKRKVAMYFAIGFVVGLIIASTILFSMYGSKQKFCKCPPCDQEIECVVDLAESAETQEQPENQLENLERYSTT